MLTGCAESGNNMCMLLLEVAELGYCEPGDELGTSIVAPSKEGYRLSMGADGSHCCAYGIIC
jgi:hypothetical protein